MSQFGFLAFLDNETGVGADKQPLGFVTRPDGDNAGRMAEVHATTFASFHSMLRPPAGKAVTVNAVAAVIRDLAAREGLFVPQFLSRYSTLTVGQFFAFKAMLERELF